MERENVMKKEDIISEITNLSAESKENADCMSKALRSLSDAMDEVKKAKDFFNFFVGKSPSERWGMKDKRFLYLQTL